jgi:hypothetical protein
VSCDYAVWHTSTRLSDAEAVALYHALCEGDASTVSANPRIDAFYSEIAALHPEIDTLPDDKIGDDDLCPWSIAIDRSPGHLIMCCVWPKADYVGNLVRTLARKHKLAMFDPQSGVILYPDTLTLTVEGEPIKRSPSIADLRSLVARMGSAKGPSVAILEGRGLGFAQAAGRNRVFTVEWREDTGGGFRHWKAGSLEQSGGVKSSGATNSFEIDVRSNERLSGADVLAILDAYLAGHSRPEQYLWRDISSMFV